MELASNCDILIVSCPLRRIINREVIDALGSEGFLSKIGRGQHVDEPEPVSSVIEGWLGGAGWSGYI